MSELASQIAQLVNGMYQEQGNNLCRSLNFFKIARNIFRVIKLQDHAAPFIQNDAFELKKWPVCLASSDKSIISFVFFI